MKAGFGDGRGEWVQRVLGTAFACLAIIYVWMLFHYAFTMWETGQRYAILYLGMSFTLVSIEYLRRLDCSVTGKARAMNGAKALLLLAGLVTSLTGCFYFWEEYMDLQLYRSGDMNDTDMVFSLALVCVAIIYTWMTSGATIPLVAIIFIAYAFFGDWLPGFMGHGGISTYRFAEISAGEISGVFGPLTVLGATYIAMFVFFAGFVQGFGGLDYVMRLSYKLVGKSRTGLPQIAVFSSLVFGCMSGSPAANAAGTGALTIPTMKRFGIPAATAAAVETVASSGGQVMPPILGAVAFVMCDYLGLFYSEVLEASFFPALIYFIVLMLSVYFIGFTHGKDGDESDIPDAIKKPMTRRESFLGIPLALALTAMVLLFIVFRLNIMMGGLIGIGTFMAAQFVYDITGTGNKRDIVKNYAVNLYRGTMTGARTMLSIAPMLAVIGVVVRILAVSGLGDKISFALITTGTENTWLYLFLTMSVCILFGMAVTTVGAYIMVVTLVAPAMIKLGTPALVTHFAVFYWALLSGFTPPVAGVCVITAQLAGANFWKTSLESMKLGMPIFILPYFFVSYPDLLTMSLNGFFDFILALSGLLALAAALQAPWHKFLRLFLMVVGCVVLFVPLAWFDFLLAAAIGAIFIYQFKKFQASNTCQGLTR